MLLAPEATEPSGSDALAWITSHTFREANATILDNAAMSVRQIADLLGHARPSLTRDVFMARGAKSGRRCTEPALTTDPPELHSGGG